LEFTGSSILLKQAKNTYIHIGIEIFSFKTNSEIIKFVSPVGNSDVPYPYAIDKDKNAYLMIENTVISNTKLLELFLKKYGEPYEYFYTRNATGKTIAQHLLTLLDIERQNDTTKLTHRNKISLTIDKHKFFIPKNKYNDLTLLIPFVGVDMGVKKIKRIKTYQKRLW
jgi:hypothetical protein